MTRARVVLIWLQRSLLTLIFISPVSLKNCEGEEHTLMPDWL